MFNIKESTSYHLRGFGRAQNVPVHFHAEKLKPPMMRRNFGWLFLSPGHESQRPPSGARPEK